MPRIYKKPNSSYYFADIRIWSAISGNWVRRRVSTRKDNPEDARVVAEALEHASKVAKTMEENKVTREHLSSIVEGIVRIAGVEVAKEAVYPLIEDYIERWIAQIQQTSSKSTYNTYKTCVNHFIKWIKQKVEGATLDSVSTQLANDYYLFCLDTMAQKSSKERVNRMKDVYTRAQQELDYPDNPFSKVRIVNSKNAETLDRMPLSFAEAKKIIKFLKRGDERQIEWSRAAMLSIMSGCRLEDAITMHSKNIEGDILKYKQHKTGKEITVPLVVPAWKNSIIGITGFICPILNEDHSTSSNANLSSEFTEVVSLSGVTQKYKEFKSGRRIARKTFHSLRHTLRTAIVSSGGSDAQADIILGHSSGQGKRYTHNDIEAMRVTLSGALKISD